MEATKPMLEPVEIELKRARSMAVLADNAMLVYLIEMAVIEAKRTSLHPQT